jgi:hypothetical protein
LLEGEADSFDDGGEHFGLGAANAISAIEVLKEEGLRLQPSIGPLPGPPHLPSGAPAVTIPADEVNLGKATPPSAREESADILGADAEDIFLVRVAHQGTTLAVQAGGAVEEGEAEGVEQGALARAGGPCDGEEASGGEGFYLEVDFEVAIQAGQVRTPNGEDLHPIS